MEPTEEPKKKRVSPSNRMKPFLIKEKEREIGRQEEEGEKSRREKKREKRERKLIITLE